MSVTLECIAAGGSRASVSVEKGSNWSQVCSKIGSALKTEVLSITYKDEDGDNIIVKTDQGVASLVKSAGKKPVQVTVTSKSSAAPAASSAASPAPQKAAAPAAATIMDAGLFDIGAAFAQARAAGAGAGAGGGGGAAPSSGTAVPAAARGTVVDMDLFAAPPSASSTSSKAGASAAEEAEAAADLARDTCSIEWERLAELGRGATGVVFKAKEKGKDRFIAVKEFHVEEAMMSKKEVANVRKEISLMASLSHPNLVAYLGTQYRNGTLFILMEYVDGGALEGKPAMPEATVQGYARQILQGLEYLHSNGVIHRDIKSANIMVTGAGVIKLGDFGASRKLVTGATVAGGVMTKVGTPLYMAPELITGQGYGRKSDIWSLGCALVEMATGRVPWEDLAKDNDIFMLMHKIASSDRTPDLPKNFSDNAIAFLKLCFTRDPKARPDVATLLQHPWLGTKK
jgi:hypothetical protein